MILEISIFILVVVILYALFDLVYQKKKLKKKGALIRILLFELVGKDKVYKGFYQGIEKEDEKIGLFVNIKGIQKAISQVNNKDFFPDYEFGKCLMVCKYAEDDFRSMSRMANDEWFRRVQLSESEYLETEIVKDEEGNEEIQLKTLDDGTPIPLIDDEQNPLPDFKLEAYEEPIGIKQSSREAQRFNRDFAKRMEEKRKEPNSFWEKYGQLIMVSMVLMIMFLSQAYGYNKMSETIEFALDKFGEKSDEIVDSVNSPGFAQGLLDKFEKKNVEENAPPK